MVKLWERCSVGALGLYLALSLLFFGRGLIGQFATAHIGDGADPALNMWFLVWWPYALFHHINPVQTHAFWAPTGFNLTWQTSIPLISLIAAPLTFSLGPITTLNLLCLISLPLSAWCTFTLCRYLTHNYWTSIVGGFIFGFSPFMVGQLTFSHLHLMSAFPVPLAVYLAARRLTNDMSQRKYAALLTVLLVAQFLFGVSESRSSRR